MYSFESIVKRLLVESANVTDIIAAIENKKVVKINYLGDENVPSGERIIEPFLLGKTTAGNLAIRAFETSGFTKTFVPNWKIFIVNKISMWEPTEETFTIRNDYNKYGDKSFNQITKKVE